MTLLPRNSGRSATWDVTVVDTLGSAYSNRVPSPGPVRLRLQISKYSSLSLTHDFFPVALETLGPLSVSAQEFVAQIGRRSTEVTTDPRETTFLFQRLSVAVQRFNAACLADTFPIFESAP